MRAKAADADILAFAAGGPVDGDAGDVLKRIGDVAIGEAAELGGIDGIEDDRQSRLIRTDLSRLPRMPVMMISWLAWFAAAVSEVLLGGEVLSTVVAGGAASALGGWPCARAAVEADAKAMAINFAAMRKVCEAMESPSVDPKVSICFIVLPARTQSNPFVSSFRVWRREDSSFSFVFAWLLVQAELVTGVLRW